MHSISSSARIHPQSGLNHQTTLSDSDMSEGMLMKMSLDIIRNAKDLIALKPKGKEEMQNYLDQAGQVITRAKVFEIKLGLKTLDGANNNKRFLDQIVTKISELEKAVALVREEKSQLQARSKRPSGLRHRIHPQSGLNHQTTLSDSDMSEGMLMKMSLDIIRNARDLIAVKPKGQEEMQNYLNQAGQLITRARFFEKKLGLKTLDGANNNKRLLDQIATKISGLEKAVAMVREEKSQLQAASKTPNELPQPIDLTQDDALEFNQNPPYKKAKLDDNEMSEAADCLLGMKHYFKTNDQHTSETPLQNSKPVGIALALDEKAPQPDTVVRAPNESPQFFYSESFLQQQNINLNILEQNGLYQKACIEPHFDIHDVHPDGNCFYYAVLKQTDRYPGMSEEQAMVLLRKEFANYVARLPDYQIKYFTEMSKKEWVKGIATDARTVKDGSSCWGGYPEFLCMASFLKRDIYLFTAKIGAQEGAHLPGDQMPKATDHAQYELLPGEQALPPLYLLYNGVNHWMWLSPKEGAGFGAAKGG